MASSTSNKCKLFIARLPWTVGGDTLREYFQKFGQVDFARVVFDQISGKSKKYGFVHFKTEESITRVLNETHHIIDGAKVLVEPVVSKEESKAHQQDKTLSPSLES